MIQIDDISFKPSKPFLFACLPRVGEVVSLEWESDRHPQFIVYKVLHVPAEVQDQAAFTVLFVRKVS